MPHKIEDPKFVELNKELGALLYKYQLPAFVLVIAEKKNEEINFHIIGGPPKTDVIRAILEAGLLEMTGIQNSDTQGAFLASEDGITDVTEAFTQPMDS